MGLTEQVRLQFKLSGGWSIRLWFKLSGGWRMQRGPEPFSVHLPPSPPDSPPRDVWPGPGATLALSTLASGPCGPSSWEVDGEEGGGKWRRHVAPLAALATPIHSLTHSVTQLAYTLVPGRLHLGLWVPPHY